MKLNGLLLFALLFASRILHAQTDFMPGFVVKTNGDTLHGSIDYRGDLLMSHSCKFKAADNAVQEFKPTDIYGYRFTDSKYYVSKEVNGKILFLEYLIKGKVNVYYMRDENGDHYYIDKENMKLTELPYEEGTKLVNDRQVYYQTYKHYGILSYYMQEAPGIQPKIQSIGKPEHRSLIKLAEDYNNIVCKEQCVIYEKKEPSTKVLIEPFVGVTRSRLFNDGLLMNEFGGFLYLSIPKANERLFFKTGFAYDYGSTNEYRLSMYKIPLQLHYLYRVHRLQPKVSGGLNLIYLQVNELQGLFYFLSLNAGIDYKINNKLALTSSFNTEYTPFGLVVAGATQFNLSYSVIVGLRLDLK